MKTRVIQEEPEEPRRGTADSSATQESGPPRLRAPRRKLVSRPAAWVQAHPLAAFFVLGYALSWAAVPFGSFFAPGALIAALIVVSVAEGTEGLKELGSRLIRWRVHWIWYVIAIAVPLAVHFSTMGANMALGAPAPSTDDFTPVYGIALAIGMNMINPFGGPFSEEPSFRGFAQARLQSRRTPLVATAILALLITGWHAPLFFVSSFGLEPYEALTTVAVTFWYGWLFDQTGGSALLTLLAHATEGSINTEDLWPSGAGATRETWLYVVIWCAVALGLVLAHRRFWTAKAPPGAVEPPAHPTPALATET
ncbi:CPBP family intramembrane metalloprotease [Streptomyces sp. NBC_00124]|uniref:CPBP family intramembrane glutamic endopeptidase n=1 Tax=Streptomyces sp. NBC_00124 TaxID=2975662 RepID=UPI002251F6A0|nr:type II CAAX endopeptidase family protein [Streptomyces sp. NBC_00124]MCX5359913.1 CPBP family intramembrane metalloprotease [Streptomyces sp. NBC_00124]